MKIFLTHRPGGAYGFISEGWANALKDCGHTVKRWDGLENTWHEFNPDLYVACSGHKQPIPPKSKRGNCLVAIHVNPYGPVKIDGINESEDNIRWTLNQKPDAVFGYGFAADKMLWGYWTQKHNIPWIPMPTAADRTIFYDLKSPRPYDVVYLGGRWQYKGLTIDSFLIPVLQNPAIKFKLHGWGDWPDNICSGVLPEESANQFLNSGKVGPCISEKHTQLYGIDIPERAWKVALCGTLVIHDPVPTMRREFRSIVMGQDEANYSTLCLHYSRHDDERLEKVALQRAEVLNNHTYHHRFAHFFKELGLADEAKNMLND
jgi:hypothetical protein